MQFTSEAGFLAGTDGLFRHAFGIPFPVGELGLSVAKQDSGMHGPYQREHVAADTLSTGNGPNWSCHDHDTDHDDGPHRDDLCGGPHSGDYRGGCGRSPTLPRVRRFQTLVLTNIQSFPAQHRQCFNHRDNVWVIGE